ncbi:MAG: L-serine ammonia-lyase [Deltaproteobacteria bacterium]|nr:L-serine ammonia-lyase [Deltaproteobacteria bacterium]
MDRRDFIKTALISSAGIGVILKGVPSCARGIPASAFTGRTGVRCYNGAPDGVIQTSLSDFFKIGPGPSSSHTIAPLRIAADFREALTKLPREKLTGTKKIEARLYGSLSSTGRGHRTDRAIIAGLLGQKPETCDTRLMEELADEKKTYNTTISGVNFTIGHSTIVWDKVEHNFPFVNTLVMRLVDGADAEIFSREYYSTGGGFFQWKGQKPEVRGKPVYSYGSMTAFCRLAAERKKNLHEIIMENDIAVMNMSEKDILTHLDLVLETMENGVHQGLQEEGVLPGPFEFHRKANRIHQQALKMKGGDNFMGMLSSYALAVSEGNAAGRLAVTAPTLGSAGTIPAIAYVMKHHLKYSQDTIRKGLLAAALVGFLCKNNASVAGAEVGCQGEIGVASAMAAAMITYASGASLEATEVAATIALEHHLGMSCDPVGGFVLIPCIERNAFGAVKAYNAYLMATNEITSQHWEDLDRVIAAMLETGKALPQAYREMGTGGLGVTMVDC